MPENSLEETIAGLNFWKIVTNFIICLIILLILSITLFWGEPDLVDSMITFFNAPNCIK